MNWQEIVKQKNLDISIISMSKLEENTRIDAEYYLPEYLIPYRNNLSILPIGDVLTKCQYGISQEMNTEGTGTEIYRMNELENCLCKDYDLKYVDIDEKTRKQYLLKPKDILFNRVNSIIFVGRTGIYKHSGKERVFASYLIRLNTDEKVVLPEYLTVFLNCKYGKKELKRKARWAVNQANINAEELKRIPLPISSLEFQSVIANYIDKTQELLDESRLLYQRAEALLLTELGLADYIPNEANTSIRDLFECLQDDRFDAEYWMPKYDEIATAVRNYRNGYDTFNNLFVIGSQIGINTESTYRYIELADVNSTLGTIENYTELLGKDLPSRGRMSLKKDDVIMSSLDGSLNKTALITIDEQNLIGSTGFFVLRKKYFEPEVALVLLKSRPIQEYIARQAQGTILTAIPKTSLSRIVLPKISNELQFKVKKLIQEAHSQKEQSKIQLEKAKRAVEIFIEQDEAKALEYLAT